MLLSVDDTIDISLQAWKSFKTIYSLFQFQFSITVLSIEGIAQNTIL